MNFSEDKNHVRSDGKFDLSGKNVLYWIKRDMGTIFRSSIKGLIYVTPIYIVVGTILGLVGGNSFSEMYQLAISDLQSDPSVIVWTYIFILFSFVMVYSYITKGYETGVNNDGPWWWPIGRYGGRLWYRRPKIDKK